jgi:3'-5' exoribonuclease
LKIIKFRAATDDDPVDWDALIEISDKDVEAMKEEFYTILEEIDDPWIHTLLKNVFSNEGISKRFFFAPAGKRFHHCYRHGLLEHVINMIRLAKTMTNFYPELNLDILIAGIIFHDFGKIWEYSDQVNIDFTDIGRLHGHIAMGYHFVMNEMAKIDNFPEKLKLEIGHLILSHQGELEKGSPVVPMTLEAIVLHHIDELDAKANAIQRVLTKDRQPESRWTSYNRLMNRYFYRNDRDNADEEKKKG